jgi:thioesterase domain-containing protein/acyl carrier protein
MSRVSLEQKVRERFVLKSPAVMSGYLNRPDLTERILCNGWIHTGDRGKIDNHGRIWLTGRIKDEINRAGFKVQPAEIDLLLERHPAIAEACVFAIPDALSGESVGAAIRLVPGMSIDIRSLRSWCLDRVREQAVPEHWLIVNDIPRTARGKLNRDAVRAIYGIRRESVQATNKSRTPAIELTLTSCTEVSTETVRQTVSAAVERAWTRILGKQSFSMNMRWDEAGGDSLNTVRLWLSLEEALDLELPLELLHPSFTPDELGGAIINRLRAYDSRPRKRKTVFLMPWAHGDVPELARFKLAFANEIKFITIRYPPWDEMLRAGAGFSLLVNAATDQVLQNCEYDSIFLAGLSFGGFVAWEVACRLAKRGHSIGFLGLIDSRRKNLLKLRKSLPDKAKSAVLLILFQPGSAGSIVLRALIDLLCGISAFPILRVIGYVGSLLPEKVAFNLRWHLASQLRSNALQKWTLSVSDVPATLFRTDDRDSDEYDTVGMRCAVIFP